MYYFIFFIKNVIIYIENKKGEKYTMAKLTIKNVNYENALQLMYLINRKISYGDTEYAYTLDADVLSIFANGDGVFTSKDDMITVSEDSEGWYSENKHWVSNYFVLELDKYGLIDWINEEEEKEPYEAEYVFDLNKVR